MRSESGSTAPLQKREGREKIDTCTIPSLSIERRKDRAMNFERLSRNTVDIDCLAQNRDNAAFDPKSTYGV